MVSQALWLKLPHHIHTDRGQRGHKWWARPCGWNDHTTYFLMGHKEATDGEPCLVCSWNVHTTYKLMGTKWPWMVSQALWLKWPHHLQSDGPQRGQEWWARPCGWNDHTTYMLIGVKEATNGEPGLVVEMNTPLTPWWGPKRPQMMSQASWSKWPHHLQSDGAQRAPKWWASPCEVNDCLNIPGYCPHWTSHWWIQTDLTINSLEVLW